MRKPQVVVLVLLLAMISVPGCRQHASSKLTIGVGQFIDHPALDDTRRGFMDEIKRLGYGDNRVNFDYQNAQGNVSDAALIAGKFAGGGYDLVFSLATPMTQAMVRAGRGRIPIVFGAITDPLSAGIVSSMEKPGGNVTGTSDRWPYDRQMRLIREVVPKAQKVCVVFNPGEDNSRYAMKETRAAAKNYGLELIEGSVSSTGEVFEAAMIIAPKCDVFYVPADNTAMAAAATIVKVASSRHIPVAAGDPGTFKAGCAFGTGISYYDLGVESAKLADKVLRREANAGDLAVVTAQNPEIYVNTKLAKELKLDIPPAILSQSKQTPQ